MSKEPDIARIYLLLENEGRAQFVINWWSLLFLTSGIFTAIVCRPGIYR